MRAGHQWYRDNQAQESAMPRYEFLCPDCEIRFEEKRTFAHADDPAICPVCHGDHATKTFNAAPFYSPGSAAKAMLEPKPATKAVPVAHGSGCPCCSGRPL